MRSNYKQATRISELNTKVEENQNSEENKSFFNENEAVKADLEKAKTEIAGQHDCITDLKDSLSQLDNDSEEKLKS